MAFRQALRAAITLTKEHRRASTFLFCCLLSLKRQQSRKAYLSRHLWRMFHTSSNPLSHHFSAASGCRIFPSGRRCKTAASQRTSAIRFALCRETGAFWQPASFNYVESDNAGTGGHNVFLFQAAAFMASSSHGSERRRALRWGSLQRAHLEICKERRHSTE